METGTFKKTLLIVTAFLLMLVTGVFWGTWFSLSRSIHVFTPEAFLAIGKTIIANVAWPMRILMPSTLLLMLGICLLYPQKKSLGFWLYLKAFLLLVAVLLITLIVLVPIDNEIKIWDIESMPSNWESLRDKWEWFHTLRTFLCMGSFLCFAWAMVVYPLHRSKTVE